MEVAPSARIPANTAELRLFLLKAQRQFAYVSGEADTGRVSTLVFNMKKSPFLRQHALALACASACFATSVLAQTAVLPEMVVTASRTEQRVQDAMPSTTLITRADIERAQSNDLPSLLRKVTGVEIAQNGGPGTVSSAFVRGGASRHTLVLVDGVAINNLSFGTASIEHLPVSNIERIEIVRGNVSSLYGSAALGGVIQIFTREAAGKDLVALGLSIGSRNTKQLDATATTKLASGTRLSATLQSLSDGGINAIDQTKLAGTNPDVDGYKRQAVSFGVSQDIGAATVGLRVRNASGTTAYDSSFGPAKQADESKFVERGASADVRYKANSALVLTAALTNSADKLKADVTAFPYFVNSQSNGLNVGAEWAFAAGQRLTAGLENTRQAIDSDTVYKSDKRSLNSMRVGYQADFGPHAVQLGLRNDKYSDFGSASTYFAGYAYRLSEAWRINGQVSSGFNAPTFNDLYNPFGGNALLKAESLQSSELGVQYAAGGQEVRAVLFTNRYSDLIDNDANFKRVNVASAKNNGLELTYRGKVGPAQLRAGLTAQNPIDATTGARLLRRAPFAANLGASQDIGAWSLGADLRYSSSRDDRSGGKTRDLESYSVVDLTARYAINKQLSVNGRIDNLLNKVYETAYGYRQVTRSAFLGLNWTM